ncbi:LON peptidase substrate-binding domain-containing protein [Aeromonas caviae]|uniref:LON peptidase substrate-binding domain-containing protein n=1 Tax=Aeromonas caviae TaxID=648 RepID=UPI001BD32895|nr:LON peptidase substrate-binding domain-containing protein [Aeromonas caviae]MBS4721826.1 LON peptidase substrate-binding domain-containing protein [Aeromonas caviae]
MTLVLFPLSAHLLPGGIMPLRIFEPRYQRMIAESREREFALCMLDPRQPDALRNMYPIATRVRIIDFDLLPDGLLGITVLGVERVRITDLWQEEDGLRVGEVEPLPPWQSGRLHADQHSLAKALQDVFNDYPEYAALYPEPDWEDASWVAQRWLEVLPIPVEQKQWLVAAKDNQPTLSLLSGLLVASH